MTFRSSSRRTPITIGVSLLLHAGFLGAILYRHAVEASEVPLWPLLVPGSVQPSTDAEPTEIEIIIIDDVPEVRTAVLTPAPEAPRPTPPAAAPSRPAAPSGHGVPDSGSPTTAPLPEAAPAPAPRSAFAMRAPGESPGVDVALGSLPESAIPALPASGVGPGDTPADELRRQRDGSYRSKQHSFTAKIDRDGRVRFDDRSSVRPSMGGDPSAPTHAIDPTLDNSLGIQGGGAGGTMDVTEMLMRKRGVDPHAHEKLAFLDRTRDQRAEIAQQHRSTQLSKSAVLMRRSLAELWASTTDLAERKQGLFELWDECAETGDPEQIAGALQARAEIMRFIRQNLRGPHAYTQAELARFNAGKQSKATFEPYRG